MKKLSHKRVIEVSWGGPDIDFSKIGEGGRLPDLREVVHADWNRRDAKAVTGPTETEIALIFQMAAGELQQIREKVQKKRPHICPICYLSHAKKGEMQECCIEPMKAGATPGLSQEEINSIRSLTAQGFGALEIHRVTELSYRDVVKYHHDARAALMDKYQVYERDWIAFRNKIRTKAGLKPLKQDGGGARNKKKVTKDTTE